MGYLSVTLWLFLACDGDFGATLGPYLAYEGAFGDPLVSLWGHSGSTLGSLSVHSRASVSLHDHCGIIVESLWVYKGRLSKNIHFPNRF